jgi:RNA polymerase sigma factor (sigma-70 family)
MSNADELKDLFERVPFEQFMLAIRTRADLNGFASFFDDLVKKVSIAIRRAFPGFDQAEDAALSAFGSFFRQAQQGKFSLEDPKNLAGLLVVIAYRKAADYYRQACSHPVQPLDGTKAPTAPAEPKEDREPLNQFMWAELERLLQRLCEALPNESYQKVVHFWYEEEFQGKRTTDEEIAGKLGVSKATVERAKRRIRLVWPPLLEEARQAVAETACRLAEGQPDAMNS